MILKIALFHWHFVLVFVGRALSRVALSISKECFLNFVFFSFVYNCTN